MFTARDAFFQNIRDAIRGEKADSDLSTGDRARNIACDDCESSVELVLQKAGNGITCIDDDFAADIVRYWRGSNPKQRHPNEPHYVEAFVELLSKD